MNLVYIHTHDSGRWFEPYGYPVKTPHIMELARDSLLFRNAFCCGPTCSPSRAAMLTGQMPHSCGMLGLAHRGFSLNNPEEHLAAFLKSNGYKTALAGIQHEIEVGKEKTLGYQDIVAAGCVMDQLDFDTVRFDLDNADKAASYIMQQGDAPFFLSFGMFNTHRFLPNHKKAGINPDYLAVPWTIADTPENRSDMADYHYSVQTVDECVGKVMKAIAQSGHNQDTVILMTTDHGLALPFMKCNLYDSGIGVAMMLSYPGNPSCGKVTDALVSQLDVYPTLCDLLGLKKPSWLQGTSLLPVIEQNDEVHSEIYSEVTYHAAYEPMRCVRNKQYKLIVRFDDYRGIVAPNIDWCPAKEVLEEADYYKWLHAREELYDLRIDPCEKFNLADEPQYKEIYHELLNKMIQWMRQTDDPLLRYRYRVPAPVGAQVNLRTSTDPQDGVYEQ